MAGLGRPLNGWEITVLSWGFLIGLLTPALAQNVQFPFPQQTTLTPEQSLLQRLPREPQFLIELNEASRMLTAGDYEAAIDVLQSLLEISEDVFDVVEGKPTGSALDRVETLLSSMPAEAIETYRRRYEPLAKQSLTESLTRGDLNGLMDIVRTYPLTIAAADATQAAGEIAFDQGETALAARLWERLLPTTAVGDKRTLLLIEISRAWTLAGQPEEAAQYVTELSILAQTAPLEYDGKLLTPPATGDAAWLNKVFGPVAPLVPQRSHDWRVSGGHPRRWGNGPAASPLQRGSWAYPLVDQYDVFTHPEDHEQAGRHKKFQSILSDLTTQYLRVNAIKTTPLVIGAPLVDGETVFVQGLGSVKAIDAHTGQLRWSGVVVDNTFLYWAERNYHEKGADPAHDRMVEIFLGQRSWMNQTGAALSSDGRQVYSISGTGIVGIATSPRNMFMRNAGQLPRHELTPPSDNRLLAYDIQSGLLQWESGGPSVAMQVDENGELISESRHLAGAFFLGAPLPFEGQLLVLAEYRGQIGLFSLSPETGGVEWSVPLLNPDSGIAFDETRRLYGLSPSYAGGLLICPTGEGVVVAVDPLRRRVAWIQQYQARTTVMNDRAMAIMRFQQQRMGHDSRLESMLQKRRWFDATPVLTAGRVLLPAPESDQLFCFEIETGKPLWKLSRGEGLFIAACTERHCVIVEEHRIRAVRLNDGTQAWSQEIPTPSGRGVVSGGKYLLPVSTNEILAIDLKSGRILARSKLDPAHHTGSLVAAGDRLLIQSSSEVIGLRPLSEMSREIAHDLQDNSLRARALSEQGELLLFQGQEQEAVALLQESLQLQDSDSTRRLLVWSLLDRLKSDYARSRSIVAELKKTVSDPDQRKLLNRINAEGLEQAGDSLGAFREYLELVPVISLSDELTEVATNLGAREDRWLRGRLTHLYSLGSDATRLQMRSAVNEVIASQDVALKPKFAYTLGIDLAPQLHLELALANQYDLFMSQRVLWALSESRDPALRGPAVARLVRNELSQQRTVYISHLVRALRQELASVECEPGVTGLALLEKFRRDVQFGPRLQTAEQPARLPSVTPKDNLQSGALHQRDVFPTLGASRGPFADWMFSIEPSPSQVVQCSDGTGKTRPTPPLGEMHLPHLRYVQTDPQLVLLAFRDRFAVISPMDPGNPVRLSVTFNDSGQQIDPLRQPLQIKAGVRDAIYPTLNNSYLGNVGPLTFDTLCYLSGEVLQAVNPHTNPPRVHWRRTGVPAGSEICADSEYVVIIPPSLDRLIVLRSSDGVQLAEHPLPKGRVDRKRADWGRLFLITRTEKSDGSSPERKTWAMYDPVTNQDAWSLTLPKGTLWAPVNGSDLAFLEPDGTLRLIEDQTGQQLWTSSLPAQKEAPEEFTVHRDEQRLYVHTWRPPSPQQDPITEELASRNGSTTSVNGLALALDHQTGKILWSRPMEQQLFRAFVPAGSGLLAYVAQRRRESAEEGMKTYNKLEFLDRSTGESILSQEPISSGTGEGWTRLPSGAMLLRVCGQDFRLKWAGDDSTPEPLPEQDEPLLNNPPDEPIKPL